MAHYTLQSGRATVTITSRCPTCHTIRYHSDSCTSLNDHTVCCSTDCYCKYIEHLYTLRDRAILWAHMHDAGYLTEGEMVMLYLEKADVV